MIVQIGASLIAVGVTGYFVAAVLSEPFGADVPTPVAALGLGGAALGTVGFLTMCLGIIWS